MRKQFIGKWLSAASAGLAALCLFAVPCGAVAFAEVAEENDYAEKEDSFYSYVQNFTDLDQVNNAFHAYYLENALGSARSELVTDDPESTESHWYIADGEICRINDVKRDEISGNYETNQIAMLTFTREAYLNFELSVDYQRGNSGFWPVVGIRQLEEGKYYLDDGAGVFVQQNGTITLWGDDVISGPYEFSSVDGYDSGAWHNLQIRVLGNQLQVSVDYAPWASQNLPSEFYDTGYVSLISVNNETKFRNFRIKALPEPEEDKIENFDPLPEADSEDALSQLAGEVKDKDTLFEREGKVNPDLVYTEEVVRYEDIGGCSGSLSGAAGLAAAIALGAVVFSGRKKR